MRKGAGLTMALIIVLTVLGCAIRPMPKYEKDPTLPQTAGRLQVRGLAGEVKVYRDHYGVPHIFTENEHDLFFADGFVQAQDRLWQMVLFRALSEGRLAELFGEFNLPGTRVLGMDVGTVAIDKRQRVMGLKYMGEVGEVLLEGERMTVAMIPLKSACNLCLLLGSDAVLGRSLFEARRAAFALDQSL